MAPRDAAVDRLERGCPVFGWRPLMEPGVKVPPWEPPDFAALLDELDVTLIPGLHDALVRPQFEQMLQQLNVPVPPPSTFDGQQMSGPDGEGRISPISVLQVGVSSDPFLSLALGFGTNVDEPLQVNFDIEPFHDGSRFDYLVAAPYARGLDGESEPVELIALALRPTRALMPPMPTGLDAVQRAEEPPAAREQPYAASALVSWERPPVTTFMRAASFAAARADVGAPDARLLMEPRPSGGHRPIAPALAKSDDDGAHVFLTDPRFEIDPVPGVRSMRYGVATQDLFGLWSNWKVTGHVATQPAPEPPRIVAATLDLPAPAGGPPGNKLCTGSLTVDLTWDWTDRGPDTITLAGRLYAAAELGADPPSSSAPNALQRTIGGVQPRVVVDFSDGAGFADVATVDGVVTTNLEYLNPEGTEFVAPGSAQSQRIRRYRLHIPGFSVDFATTTHVGLALWIEGRERLVPGRVTAQVGPFLTFASDPVAPPSHDRLPDRAARQHARRRRAQPRPAVVAGRGRHRRLLRVRGRRVHAARRVGPARARPGPFPVRALRRDPRPLPHRSGAPAVPAPLVARHHHERARRRDAQGLALHPSVRRRHRWPGGTEGPWPGPVGPDDPMQLYAYAAPRRRHPATPGAARHRRRVARPGGRRADDAHRVRRGARSTSTGCVSTTPPGSWTRWARPSPRSQPPAAAAGPARRCPRAASGTRGWTRPSPSWRRVWYRAVAWSVGDPFRGLVPGRSAPSNPFSVVLPPAGAPNLSALSAVWPGGNLANVEVRFSSTAPRWKTALGWHRLEVMVLDMTDPASPQPILPGPAAPPGALVRELGSIGTVPPSAGSALWVSGGGSPAQYRLTVARSAAAEPLLVVVRMIDPLGRVTDRRLDVAAGSLLGIAGSGQPGCDTAGRRRKAVDVRHRRLPDGRSPVRPAHRGRAATIGSGAWRSGRPQAAADPHVGRAARHPSRVLGPVRHTPRCAAALGWPGRRAQPHLRGVRPRWCQQLHHHGDRARWPHRLVDRPGRSPGALRSRRVPDDHELGRESAAGQRAAGPRRHVTVPGRQLGRR